MANSIITLFFVIAIIHMCSLRTTAESNDDPCEVNTVLNSLKQRLVGYNLSVGESPLCDYYMAPGWYSMGSTVIASTEEACGTIYNWYMQGDLPTEDEIKQVTVCRNAGEGKICSQKKIINVKRCNNTYVFELEAPDGCPEAYCIENLEPTGKTDTPPDISAIKPEVTPIVTRPTDTNILNFCCDFIPPQGTNYFYVVEWGISSGLSWTHTLKQFEPFQYVNQSDFRKKTALTERMLSDKNFGQLGFTIACSISAQNTLTGASSTTRESLPKFFGFEVLNKTVRVSNNEDKTIYLRLTAPFGCAVNQNGICTMPLNVFIPRNEDRCQIPELSQKQGNRNRCGVEIKNDKINEWVPLRLTAFNGETRVELSKGYKLILATQQEVPIHPFFGNYFLDPIMVEVHTDMTLLKDKLCYSYNDPHMGSFDDLSYENQNSGKFLLYRNKLYKTQVQMQTTECYKNIWCNCGVAVSAGRDVFLVNNCGNGDTMKWDIRFRECKDRILRRKVKKENEFNYKIFLPTGTLVTIMLSGALLNVNIAPGLADFENTEGLCGPFDKNKGNDRDKRPGSTEADPNISWRVTPQEDLFDSRNDNNLEPWQEELFLCSCNADTSSTETVDKVTCHPEVSKTCSDNRLKPILEHQCSLITRKKRNVHGLYVSKELDIHQTVKTNFVSKRSVAKKGYFPRKVNKRKAYDYDSAKADCLEIFNTTTFITCSSIPGINFDDFLENCILDAQISSSMEWSMTHLEAIKDKCFYEVKVNQPLPVEELADIEIIVNNTVINANTSTNDSAAVPEIPSFSTELFQSIKDTSCPNDCNGNGECKTGQCVCDGVYIGDDCSVDRTLPPVMVGIPDRGECDLQLRLCEQTSVFGTNFAETDDLTCHLEPFLVDSNSETVISGKSLKTKAELQTFVEVSCPLPRPRKELSTESEQSDHIAYGYTVSVSNDGIKYSEEDILVIFDSECVNCTKEDGNVICRQKLGYCIKHGQCYRFGETYGCMSCVGGDDSVLSWEAGQDCPVPVEPSKQPKKLWIIAAVISPFVCAIAIVGLLYYLSKRNKKGTADLTLDSVHKTKTGSPLQK